MPGGTDTESSGNEARAAGAPRASTASLVLLILTALLLNISGAVICKFVATTFLTQLWLSLGLLALLGLNYLGRIFFWTMAGRRFQLSFFYPVLSINYFFSFVLGMLIFGEGFEWTKLIGSWLIVLGVAWISTTKHRAEVTAEVV